MTFDRSWTTRAAEALRSGLSISDHDAERDQRPSLPIDPPPGMQIVQIAACANDGGVRLLALCDDRSVWLMHTYERRWEQIISASSERAS